MATLPAITHTDTGALVKQHQDFFFPDGPRIPLDARYKDRPTRATPRAMLVLIDQLDDLTNVTNDAALKEGVLGSSNMSQWSNDSTTWVHRLNAYRAHVEGVAPENMDNLVGADQIYFWVTAPLLDGVFYEALPGIQLTEEEHTRMAQEPPEGFSNRKPPDVYVPFSLGNQVLVFREHQRERFDKLFQYLREAAGEVLKTGEKGWDRFIEGAIFAAKFAGVGLVGYLSYRAYIAIRYVQPRQERFPGNNPG